MLTILFLGDVVGEPGRSAVITRLPELKEKYGVDFIVVNGENAAGGRGITGKITIDLLRAGVSVVTTGDHIWDQKDIFGYIDTEPRLLRPINYPDGAPGHGAIVLETPKGRVGVINVQARTFMLPILENPFHAMERAVTEMHEETNVIFVDIHGETTSEKIALARFLDGKVSAVVGTHTHVQTADEQIFPDGTAFLCDAGMCGPVNSILGRAIEPIVQRFISNLPASFPVARGEVRLRGALIEIDERTGRAHRISRVDETGVAAANLDSSQSIAGVENECNNEQLSGYRLRIRRICLPATFIRRERWIIQDSLV
jgi:metallophosphoesterase (TIGR00282 family)